MFFDSEWKVCCFLDVVGICGCWLAKGRSFSRLVKRIQGCTLRVDDENECASPVVELTELQWLWSTVRGDRRSPALHC